MTECIHFLLTAQLLFAEASEHHEAQLKLASDVYSTDKMHMYQELKAKDKITQDIKEAYELKSIAYELKSIAYDLLLEAIQLKDEEIERLKELIRRYESDERRITNDDTR